MNPMNCRSEAEDIWSALNFIPADDREIWVKIGMALKAELGAEGFSLWDGWSQSADSYSARAARDVWRSIKGGSIGIGTLFHVAKKNGWRALSGTQKPIPRAKPAPITDKRSTSTYARELWLKSDWQNVATHPYAIAKGIDWGAGAARVTASGKVIGKKADCVIVPIKDLQTDKVVAVQCINHAGAKQTFGSISGNGFICGNTLDKSIRWFVVEGWADAVSMVFHHYKGDAVAFAACGKSSMDKLAEKVVEIYAPDQLIILEDAA